MEELKELGLTKNESKVYQTLLNHHKLGSGDTSKFSGVPYSRIYEVLDSLEQKGIVRIIPEKTKKFVLSNPEQLLEIVNKKEENLQRVKNKIKEIKKVYGSKEENPVSIGYGKKAFHKIAGELKDSKKTSYAIKWLSDLDPQFIGSVERGLKEGKKYKALVRYDEETKENVDEWLKVQPNQKKFANKGVAIGITDQGQVMIGLIKSNTTLLINDKPFADIMKRMFLETYKNSEKIK